MGDLTTESIDKFIKEREQTGITYRKTPVRFTKLLRNINNLPKGTTGWFYVNEHLVKHGYHLFEPYDPLAPKKWVDKYGTQQIDYVKKEDVE